jgi:hypothetical protein
MADRAPYSPEEKQYIVQYNNCCNFVVGLSAKGEQVLMGVVGVAPLHVVAVFFNKSGEFLRNERRLVRFVEREQRHADRHDSQVKALWHALDAWKGEIGLTPNEIRITKFHLPEWDHWGEGIGLFDLPQFMQDGVDGTLWEKDEQCRRELLKDIEQFRNKGKYVLRWGTEYWISKEGEITET